MPLSWNFWGFFGVFIVFLPFLRYFPFLTLWCSSSPRRGLVFGGKPACCEQIPDLFWLSTCSCPCHHRLFHSQLVAIVCFYPVTAVGFIWDYFAEVLFNPWMDDQFGSWQLLLVQEEVEVRNHSYNKDAETRRTWPAYFIFFLIFLISSQKKNLTLFLSLVSRSWCFYKSNSYYFYQHNDRINYLIAFPSVPTTRPHMCEEQWNHTSST